ncbi:leukemia inhibitory factor receptor-like isoform X2 [Myxocyprinus asiaticus]|uniref:leukemia inhibitory factor receptor-like isoform X2 n=1 Tax=Myxocyprinus asiaticus TaxID=70543 RepID=UPI002221E2FB|nr:leukemia inhibitory factor receptor-like isoform X2 [Myxocyprinus asiaticus]
MLEEHISTKMILNWAKMLIFIIFFENMKEWNSHSSDNVTVPSIIKLRALDMWRLEMMWSMNQTEIQRNQMYEIQVGRSKNMDIIDKINVSRFSLEAEFSVHTLVWISQLPLNCVDHSVRIRHISDASPSSSWSSWKTNNGVVNMAHGEIRMYPNGQVLKEGSTVFFCCVYSKDVQVTSMFFGNTAYKVINISPQQRISQLSRSLKYKPHSVPPEKPQDIRCDTKDMRFVSCSWKSGRAPNLGGSRKSKYTLLIRDSKAVSCSLFRSHPESCSFRVIPEQTTYNITLLVTNSLGEEKESYIFNIIDRVFPVPEHVEVTASVLEAVVVLQLNGSFKGLSLICQIALEPGGTIQELQQNGSDSVQLYTFRLKLLQPSTRYSTRGRCAVQGNDWGRWTLSRPFVTEPLVTVDLWRRIRDHPNRTVTLLWHTVNTGSKSDIEVYEVCVSHRDPPKSVCTNFKQTKVDLTVDVHVCDITVRAVTQIGLSVPSHITIPSAYTGGMLKEKRIMGNPEGFQLLWSKDSATTCDYTIEWCMLESALSCTIKWRKVPANQTSLSLKTGDFKMGVRYTFTVYGCNVEGHRPHEKQIGYLKEQKPNKYPTLDPNPSVTWSSINLKWSFNEEDPTHPGFITGYMITVQRDSNSGSNLSFYPIVDPHIKSFTFSDVQEDQPYKFHLAACTSVGCGPETSRTFRTGKNYYLLSAKIFIPLMVLVGCCFCLCSYRKMLIPEEAFGFLHIKSLDLDEDLYEASEKIRTLRIEECNWCDVEISDTQTTMAEKTWLTSAEDPSCSFISPNVGISSSLMVPYQLTADMWDRTATSLNNFTYVSTVQQVLPAEMFKTIDEEGMKQEPDNSGFTSDYVTSAAI